MRSFRFHAVVTSAVLCLVAALIVLVHPSPSLAADAGGQFWEASGPLAPGQPIEGYISAEGDVDWYYFYVGSRSDVSVGYSSEQPNGGMELFRYDAGALARLGEIPTNNNGELRNQLEPGVYFVRVAGYYPSDDPVLPYQLSVTGSGVVVQRPAAVARVPTSTPVPEMYETSFRQAYGPLAPNRDHVGLMSAEGDVDWFYFYVARATDVSVGYYSEMSNLTLSLYKYRSGAVVLLDELQSNNPGRITMRLDPGAYSAPSRSLIPLEADR